MRALLGFSLLLVACQTSSAPEPSKVSAAPQPASSSAVRTPEGTPFGTPITGGDAPEAARRGPQGSRYLCGQDRAGRGSRPKGLLAQRLLDGARRERGSKAAGCRVTFKDYGFFVPTDSAGSEALVEGTLEVATVKARHVEHLEEEGASFSDKQSDGTAREVRLVATGVELRRL